MNYQINILIFFSYFISIGISITPPSCSTINPSTTSLYSFYPLCDSATVANDYSGNGRHGTMYNSPVVSATKGTFFKKNEYMLLPSGGINFDTFTIAFRYAHDTSADSVGNDWSLDFITNDYGYNLLQYSTFTSDMGSYYNYGHQSYSGVGFSLSDTTEHVFILTGTTGSWTLYKDNINTYASIGGFSLSSHNANCVGNDNVVGNIQPSRGHLKDLLIYSAQVNVANLFAAYVNPSPSSTPSAIPSPTSSMTPSPSISPPLSFVIEDFAEWAPIAITRYDAQFCYINTTGAFICPLTQSCAGTPAVTTTFNAIYAGYGDACHLFGKKVDGTVYGFGYNGESRVSGISTTTSFPSLALGGHCSFGLNTDGTLAVAGYNAWGQCTNPGGTYKRIAGQYVSTCAITTTGTLSCWGESHGSLSGQKVLVTAGDKNYCALDAAGGIQCTGWNGIATTGIPPLRFVAVNSAPTACGITQNFSIICFGSPLNDGPPTGSDQYIYITTSGGVFCGVTTTGLVRCWNSASAALLAALPNITALVPCTSNSLNNILPGLACNPLPNGSASPTPSKTPSNSITPSNSPTSSSTNTMTATSTQSSTATATKTSTTSSTASSSATSLATVTSTSSAIASNSAAGTATSVSSTSATPSSSSSSSASGTTTAQSSATATYSSISTRTSTSSSSASASATATGTATATATSTSTAVSPSPSMPPYPFSCPVQKLRLYKPTYNPGCPGSTVVRQMPHIAEIIVIDSFGNNISTSSLGITVPWADSAEDDDHHCGCNSQQPERIIENAYNAIDGDLRTSWSAKGAMGGCSNCPCSTSPWIQLFFLRNVCVASVALIGSASGSPNALLSETITNMDDWVVELQNDKGKVIGKFPVYSEDAIIDRTNTYALWNWRKVVRTSFIEGGTDGGLPVALNLTGKYTGSNGTFFYEDDPEELILNNSTNATSGTTNISTNILSTINQTPSTDDSSSLSKMFVSIAKEEWAVGVIIGAIIGFVCVTFGLVIRYYENKRQALRRQKLSKGKGFDNNDPNSIVLTNPMIAQSNRTLKRNHLHSLEIMPNAQTIQLLKNFSDTNANNTLYNNPYSAYRSPNHIIDINSSMPSKTRISFGAVPAGDHREDHDATIYVNPMVTAKENDADSTDHEEEEKQEEQGEEEYVEQEPEDTNEQEDYQEEEQAAEEEYVEEEQEEQEPVIEEEPEPEAKEAEPPLNESSTVPEAEHDEAEDEAVFAILDECEWEPMVDEHDPDNAENPESHKVYYVNKHTGEKVDYVPLAYRNALKKTYHLAEEKMKQDASVINWETVASDELLEAQHNNYLLPQQPYYYVNQLTDESTWVKPESLRQLDALRHENEQRDIFAEVEDWEQIEAENNTGKTKGSKDKSKSNNTERYWYNKRTHQTTWDTPKCHLLAQRLAHIEMERRIREEAADWVIHPDAVKKYENIRTLDKEKHKPDVLLAFDQLNRETVYKCALQKDGWEEDIDEEETGKVYWWDSSNLQRATTWERPLCTRESWYKALKAICMDKNYARDILAWPEEFDSPLDLRISMDNDSDDEHTNSNDGHSSGKKNRWDRTKDNGKNKQLHYMSYLRDRHNSGSKSNAGQYNYSFLKRTTTNHSNNNNHVSGTRNLRGLNLLRAYSTGLFYMGSNSKWKGRTLRTNTTSQAQSTALQLSKLREIEEDGIVKAIQYLRSHRNENASNTCIRRFLVFIDCSKTNKVRGQISYDKRSLHDISSVLHPNPYQQVITAVGKTACAFMTDNSKGKANKAAGNNKYTNIFGFGDVRSRDKNVFAMNTSSSNAVALNASPLLLSTLSNSNNDSKIVTDRLSSIQEALHAYASSIPIIALLQGNRSFAASINKAIEIIQDDAQGKDVPSTICLIITDGVPDDMHPTLTAINEAMSYSSLHIIIIGVGDDSFTGMDILNKYSNVTFISVQNVYSTLTETDHSKQASQRTTAIAVAALEGLIKN